MRRNDELARLVHGMDDPGQKVGERLPDARAGLEEQRLVGFHRGGNGAGHLLLLRTMLELQALVQPAALGEDFGGKLGRATRWRGRRGGVGVFVQANHEAVSVHDWSESGRCK